MTRARLAAIGRAAAPLAVVAIAVGVLLRFPPESYTFYPACPIYRSLHVQCPGCGATRALAALLHGRVAEAMRLNMLTTMLTPFAAIYGAICYRRFLRREPLQVPRLPHSAVYITLALAAIFSIVRNLGHI
ncbi:DUF2752 domain-containing protein [Edaphobacter dinghuensis]|uniref:DUF2752 domain-containing protein n=1 Tax=Edaphobacter dinghuensis TaxID=1560005 RepID=A0A917LWN1_9BACT|nr:DUF2752 domain-containing protein [Edaphobacter dinghuensis]GGG63771.1 hypothetical protein GCM10011585_01690 [Edaphobacter dinghuensis]